MKNKPLKGGKMLIPKTKETGEQKIKKITKILKETICLFKKTNPSGKNGGFLCIRDSTEGKLLLLRRIGTCPPSKNKKYKFYAAEKAAKLARNKNELSSYQCYQEKCEEAAGGVRTDENIISFSGLSEEGDEACMLILAIKLGWIDEDTAYEIGETSKNDSFTKMFGQLISA